MISSVECFLRRVARIPIHGIGLSVDVYSPALLELHDALDRAGARPEYLEIFKARTPDLACIRAALPSIPLAYHAEGLWLTEPGLRWQYPWTNAVETIARHAEAIGARWVNHECAAKQFGGYSFGTYLPPLFTDAAAQATAANTALAQEALDRWYAQQGQWGSAPLLLLELPPLTYFAFGSLTVSEYFARIVETVPCGLVLDIGHLWTVWRYRERRRFGSLEAFAADFLDTFPLDRVVQIHLAGLDLVDGTNRSGTSGALPFWVDTHAAPVPPVLFDLFRQVLAHPSLTSLKGIALEVDTKAIPLIVEEFGRLQNEPACRKVLSHDVGAGHPAVSRANQYPAHSRREGVNPSPTRRETDERLADLYTAYARVVSGQDAWETSPLAALAENVDPESLARYTTRYLPHELLTWGGDLEELFPTLWDTLKKRGMTSEDFVRSWFQESRAVTAPYDFFYVKLERWVAFVGEAAPDLVEEAAREAGILRALHAELNDEVWESKERVGEGSV